jgi:hypothetical protein
MISSAIGGMLATPNHHGLLANRAALCRRMSCASRYGKIAGMADPAVFRPHATWASGYPAAPE